MPTLGAMKKEELIEAIRALGEEPPVGWKVMDLKCRLQELQEEQGISRKAGVLRTDLETWVIRLKHASKKKDTLTTFVKEDLGGEVTGTETMEKLTRLAMDRIYAVSKAHGQDPVGMGKHSALTYTEVLTEYPDYAKWVIKTAEEGEAHYRLVRLANWLKIMEKTHGESPRRTIRRLPQSVPVVPKTKSVPKEYGSPSTSSEASELMKQTQEMVATMAARVEALHADVESMREERPRKKGTESNGSMSDFSHVSEMKMEK